MAANQEAVECPRCGASDNRLERAPHVSAIRCLGCGEMFGPAAFALPDCPSCGDAVDVVPNFDRAVAARWDCGACGPFGAVHPGAGRQRPMSMGPTMPGGAL